MLIKQSSQNARTRVLQSPETQLCLSLERFASISHRRKPPSCQLGSATKKPTHFAPKLRKKIVFPIWILKCVNRDVCFWLFCKVHKVRRGLKPYHQFIIRDRIKHRSCNKDRQKTENKIDRMWRLSKQSNFYDISRQ